jgi:hypothetical protein
MAIELERPLPATVLAEQDGLDDVQLAIASGAVTGAPATSAAGRRVRARAIA